MAVRAFLPNASAVWVVEEARPAERHRMRKVHGDGFWEVVLPGRSEFFRYLLLIEGGNGDKRLIRDPYSFLPILGELDRHLYAEGTHLLIYEKLGAHLMTVDGIPGVHFAVWAPNAKRVSVVGDFNSWDGRIHQMRVLGSSGIWEIFIPGLGEGIKYKFEVKARNNIPMLKSDPFAFRSELRPASASEVWSLNKYSWGDTDWMERRRERKWHVEPLAVYEVHLGSWRRVPEEKNRWLTYRESARQLVQYVKEMGYNTIELLPVAEHPLDWSWGYQVTGYYCPTSRYGRPEDFMYFVDMCHREGIAVIIDWVPAHFPKDAHGLSWFDGTGLYEHADPRLGEHRDWGTKVFNYGRPEVSNFLLANALFWFDKYHVDGIRADAVASMLYLDYSRRDGEWIPNKYGGKENLEAISFLKRLNEQIYAKFPGAITIAEESTSWSGVSRPTYLGGLGFGFKWNMGWMHDVLSFFSKECIYRRYHMNLLTFGMLYAYSENFILPFSHDEVVHGKGAMLSKMPGDTWQKFANLRLLYTYMYGFPGKKHLFMGGEFGQWREWNCMESLDWHLLQYAPHKGLQLLVKDLNRIYFSDPAMYEMDYDPAGFEWIDFSDADSTVVSFLRWSRDRQDMLLFICNCTPVPRKGYRIGVPFEGAYREILNSDATCYGGSNMGNGGWAKAEPVPKHNRPYSLNLTLPPLGGLIFKLYRPEGRTTKLG